MDLKQLESDFLSEIVAEKGDSKPTIEAYKTDLDQFIERVQNEEKKELTPTDVDDFISALSEAGAKESTIRRKEVVISCFYRYLLIQGFATKPLKHMDFPREMRLLPDSLSPEQIQSIIDSLQGDSPFIFRDRTMVALTFSCGLRCSELIGLKTDSLDLDAAFLKVHGKGDKERIVPLSEELVANLKEWLEVRKKLNPRCNSLFIGRGGKGLTRQRFNEILKVASIHGLGRSINPHKLRHSFATALMDAGAPLREVQELLGHERIETTQIYTHISKKTARDRYDAIVGEGLNTRVKV